ncbi:MAG: SDR family NAD(P)-dependent oxidoreductase, partial [Paracoccaceae bacterium]
MKHWDGKRYWLVGASEGLGAALAKEMSAAGATLILSARNTARLEALAAELPGPSEVVACDVSSDDSVAAAAEKAGEIDGVIYLAGLYWPMAAQNWDSAQATAMSDVNLTGALRVLWRVAPDFAARDAGHIVITGSLAGFRGLPASIGYSASKAGAMVLAECLYKDFKESNVQVQLVNPGFIKTRLTDKNKFHMPFLMETEKAAQIMFRHMNTQRFKISFPRL